MGHMVGLAQKVIISFAIINVSKLRGEEGSSASAIRKSSRKIA